MIWAAGVKGCILEGIPGKLIENGRIAVDSFNRIKGLKDIFAIGDVASMQSNDFPDGHPLLAPVAIQQGKLLARNAGSLEDLQQLSGEDEPVMLCFEQLPFNDDNWCHRRMVAEWFGDRNADTSRAKHRNNWFPVQGF